MKRNILFIAGLFVLLSSIASCAGRNAEKEREDSIRIADSIAAAEAAQAAAEQARLDSIRQDSINNATAGLTFQMFCYPEKVEGVTLQSFLTLKQIKSKLEEIGFTQTGSQQKKEKEYDWTPNNPSYYTKTITTFSKTIGENTTTVTLGGADGDVFDAKIEFPKSKDVEEFKSTVKGKLKDSNVYWHAIEISYKGNTVVIEAYDAE